MEPKAEIFVKAGATLEINSAILNKCTYMWRGITVESGGNIQVYNNGVIADAEKAMTMEDETSFTLDNANLVNNVTGVFVPQNPVDAMWNINGYCAASYFALTGPLASPYPGQTPFGKIPYAGMDISNVYMTIGDNSKMYNTFGELNLGILTRSSFLEVRNSFFATIFKDLAYGNNKHDGSCIAAFGGHGTSFRLDVYPISPLAQFPPPTMTQADRGVYSKFINTKIAGVKMNSMKTGVETELCTNGMETKVFDCEINARDYGINWYNNAGSSNMLAANNNIRVHGNKFGACVRIAELNQFANYKITDNDLYAVEILNGIVSTAVVKPQITYNRVYQNTLGVNKPSSDGITINGGFGAMLTCNNVYTNYPYLGNTRGYVINGSQSYLIECNHCYGHVTGFYFGGDCSNSQDAFRGNSMSNCLEGLYLNNTALISTQTLRGNQWLGNAGPYGAENQNTGFLNASKFEVNNTPIQFPNTPTFMPNNIGWFSINPLSVYDCATNSTCIAQAQDGDDDAAFRYQVAHDSTITAAYIPEAKNIAQQNLYDALMSVSTTIYSDSVMYNFYINNANGNIGKLYEAKQKFYASNEPNPYKLMLLKTCDSLILVKKDSIELIDSLNNNAALIGYETLRENLINSISSIVQSQAIISAQIKQDADNAISIMETENSAVQATEVPETNEKYINEIHVLYNDQGLDGIKTHYNDILAIAQQCPYSGGNAVYIARNYIALLGDTIVYDDAAICLLQGIFRNASTNTNAIEIYLKPNPANDYVELFIANNTGTNCSVSISDAIGKEHLSIKVDCKLKAVKINTQKLAIGLYTVSFSAEGLVLKTQKLIIER
ncbi:MAG: T9SS type A sorting domain-containing protein [Bacteroidetes bacterium]|nr:T9SS type A sorting domain-containing protein [Bacteroidota bacterium]